MARDVKFQLVLPLKTNKKVITENEWTLQAFYGQT